MVTTKNKKAIRKPRSILIDPDAVHRVRVEALRARKSLEQWLKETIEERLEREEREKTAE